MNKLWEIGKAWENVVTGGPEVKALAEERMKVCQDCPFKEQIFGIDTCGECGCPLKGKTHSPINSCPKKKWER